MGIRISKDHLHPSVIESITSLIGDLNQLETTAKGNAVEAINELLANGGNKEELEALIAEIAEGKELIANAVGEPLTAEESFDEMSTDINGLLATFKTNMMNNGIIVESGDKFKALIDKIATMVEEGSGKGIHIAEGTITADIYQSLDNGEWGTDGAIFKQKTKTITTNCGFIPSLVFIVLDTNSYATYLNSGYHYNTTGCTFSNIEVTDYGSLKVSIDNITIDSFRIVISSSMGTCGIFGTFKWYAIGVGEEDTTLRDSLASILQEEGVSVTEEDDMASLITKVDEEFDRKNANSIIEQTGTFTITELESSEGVYLGFHPTYVYLSFTYSNKSFEAIYYEDEYSGEVHCRNNWSVDNSGTWGEANYGFGVNGDYLIGYFGLNNSVLSTITYVAKKYF